MLARCTLALLLSLAAFPGAPAAVDLPGGPVPLVAAFFPEGPCFLDGRLHYVDYAGHALLAWDGGSARRVWHRDKTGPASVIALKNGNLLVAAHDEGTLIELTRDGKELSATKAPDGKAFDHPNDFVLDRDGGVFFSASGPLGRDAEPAGKIYYRDPDGKIQEVAAGLHYPNGLALVEGGTRLLVAESLQNRVLRYAVGKGGRLGERTVWKRLADLEPTPNDAPWAMGPDGIKVDASGNVFICQFGTGRILVAGPDGARRATIAVPLKGVTNLAFVPGKGKLIVTAVKDGLEPYLGAVYEVAIPPLEGPP